MTIRPSRLTLLALLSSTALAASAQTTTHRSTATHKSATATHTAARPAAPETASPADNPPGIPPVTAAPRPLYALRYVDIVVGDGPLAPPQKFYTVKYTGWLTDGTKFDSSDDHPGKEPITFFYGAHRVIPGWDTGFQGMRTGGKRRLYIPYQLAYGEAGREGAIPPKADLIFDIELVSFADTPPQPAAPPTPPQPSSDPSGQPSDPTKPASTPPPASSNPEAPTPQPQSTQPKSN